MAVDQVPRPAVDHDLSHIADRAQRAPQSTTLRAVMLSPVLRIGHELFRWHVRMADDPAGPGRHAVAHRRPLTTRHTEARETPYSCASAFWGSPAARPSRIAAPAAPESFACPHRSPGSEG